MHVITCQHRDPVDVSDKEEQAEEGGENLREPLLETRRSCVIPPTELRRSPIYDVLAIATPSFPGFVVAGYFCQHGFFLSFEARFHATMETLLDVVVVVFSRQVSQTGTVARYRSIKLFDYAVTVSMQATVW